MKEYKDYLLIKSKYEENIKSGKYGFVGLSNNEYSFYTLVNCCLGNERLINIMVENGLLGGSFQNGNNHLKK